jgi:hypothetical protein
LGANRTWAPERGYGLVGQGGVVIGILPVLQLQLSGGPLLSAQDTTDNTTGGVLNAQVQANTSKDPQAQNNFFVLAGSLGQQGSPSVTVGGVSATYGHEWITRRDPAFSLTDYNHPRLQWDVNLTPGVVFGAGGVRANSTFNYLVTGTASGAFTYSWGYYRDALAPGSGLAPSNIPHYTLGADAYVTAGGGRLTGQTPGGGVETHGASSATAGVDVFGSFTSSRLDYARAEGNNRITLGWAVGGFVVRDESGLHGASALGGGVRALVVLTFGRGADRPPAPPTPTPTSSP